MSLVVMTSEQETTRLAVSPVETFETLSPFYGLRCVDTRTVMLDPSELDWTVRHDGTGAFTRVMLMFTGGFSLAGTSLHICD